MNTLALPLATPASLLSVPIAPPFDPDGSPASRYRAILQRKIQEGARLASRLLDTIQREQARDQILRTRGASFQLAPGGSLRVLVGSEPYELTGFALGQIAGRAGIPLPYLRKLLSPSATDWQRALALEMSTGTVSSLGCDRSQIFSVLREAAHRLLDVVSMYLDGRQYFGLGSICTVQMHTSRMRRARDARAD